MIPELAVLKLAWRPEAVPAELQGALSGLICTTLLIISAMQTYHKTENNKHGLDGWEKEVMDLFDGFCTAGRLCRWKEMEVFYLEGIARCQYFSGIPLLRCLVRGIKMSKRH